jgi:hypothetical protein
MDKLCRSCKESISESARVCTYCGSPQTLFGHFAAALKWIGGIATVVSLVLAVNSLINLSQTQFEKREALHELADAADQLRDDGDYARAWALYSDAEKLDPGSRRVRRGQEVLAEEWLPNVQITGTETFTDIVNKALPVLMRALVRSDGTKKADFQALIGWSHYLEQRERRIQDTDVPGLYRRALELDPDNAYANTFLGHWYFSQDGEMEKGLAHFKQALDSGKHRLFVRDYQWSGLSNLKRQTGTGDEDHIVVRAEQLKMIHQMLVNDEPWVTGRSDRMPRETIEAYGQPYSPRYDWFDKVWPALQPEQHLQLVTTMAAEFSEDSYLWPLSQFLLGRIQEKLNNYDQALSSFQKLDARIAANDKLREPLDVALERLTGQQPAYVLLRTDPLAFHADSLVNKVFDNPDYALAISYFDELVSKVYYQQELDKVEPAVAALRAGSERVALWLEQHDGSQNGKDELIDAYWNLSGELGELLLYQRELDESVAQFKKLAEDARLRRWMQMDAYYNLACSLSLRSQTASAQQQDKQQAVASLLKTIEFGYNKWEHIKRDADLDAIRDHPEYIRVMTGR